MTPTPAIVLDRAAVRAVDAAAIDEYGIPGIVLMENASRSLAGVALELLERDRTDPPRVLIVSGKGNNGGDGYAAARHLANAGVEITLAPLGEPRPESNAGVNAAICRHMGLPIVDFRSIKGESFDLVVDAIFGTGLDRPPAGEPEEAITRINEMSGPRVLSVDVPSGLDCDTGAPLGASVIRADVTVTFVAMKPGFLASSAKAYTGEVIVKGIGAPAELIRRLARERA